MEWLRVGDVFLPRITQFSNGSEYCRRQYKTGDGGFNNNMNKHLCQKEQGREAAQPEVLSVHARMVLASVRANTPMSANNANFGDPVPHTHKVLAVEGRT